LLGPFVGTIADRFPRIRMVRASQFGIATLFFSMGALLFIGTVELWHIYLYTFLNGLLFLFDIPARRTYMSAVVGSENITAALALDMITSNLAWFVGSNVAGALLAQTRPEYVYMALGVMGLSNILVIRTLPTLWRPREYSDREPFLASMRAGAQFSWRHKAILGVLLAVGITNMTGFPFESMAPVFAREFFDAGPLLFGMLLSAQGLGSLLVATLLVASGRRFRRPGLLVVGASMVQHVGSIGLTFLTNAIAGMAAFFMLGGVAMVFSIMHNTFFLAATPDSMRGRVMGIQLLVIGLYPLGTLTLGALANELGAAQATRITSAIGLALMTIVFLAFRDLRYPARQLGIEAGLAAAVSSRAQEHEVEAQAAESKGQMAAEVEEKAG
jgi:MFS family permease